METPKDNSSKSTDNIIRLIPSAKEMTPLELNSIRLDVNRTVLTPDYLERLKPNINDQISNINDQI